MFIAFFTERKNIADTETLIQLYKDFSLDEIELKARLEDKKYKYEIAQDIKQAQSVGVTGVSFFLF